jgi:hypothetical protein
LVDACEALGLDEKQESARAPISPVSSQSGVLATHRRGEPTDPPLNLRVRKLAHFVR